MSFHCQQFVVDAMRNSSYFKADIICLLLMARKANNKTYRTCVSVQTLMYELQRSDSSVRRYIKKWRSRGVLEKLAHGGNGRASLYAIHEEKLKEWADLRSLSIDRRYTRQMTEDLSITVQKNPYHRSQRSDRQSDNRSLRSNGSSQSPPGEVRDTEVAEYPQNWAI